MEAHDGHTRKPRKMVSQLRKTDLKNQSPSLAPSWPEQYHINRPIAHGMKRGDLVTLAKKDEVVKRPEAGLAGSSVVNLADHVDDYHQAKNDPYVKQGRIIRPG